MECSWKKIVTRPSDALWTWADAWWNVQMKPIKLKTQRSASIPEISSSQSSLPPSHRRSPSPGLDPQLHPSPLQDVLQRAKERERERGLGNERERIFFYLTKFSYCSASPSPSVSEGEREAEREESAVASMISAHGWREGNVDGSEDEMKERWVYMLSPLLYDSLLNVKAQSENSS